MICLSCKKETENPKFCSRSCAVSRNNLGVRRNGKPPKACLNCTSPVKRNKSDYCSVQCVGEANSKRSKERLKSLFNSGIEIKRAWVYEFLVERDGNECYSCHITEWNKKPIRLWVDHIDGCAANCVPENFRLVCPN